MSFYRVKRLIYTIFERIKKSHAQKYTKMTQGIPPLEKGDFYLTEEGYKVFTEQYHLKRGHCCQSNCRHCPFGYDPKKN